MASYVDASLVTDITANLPSLKFEPPLSHADLSFSKLRHRSHALTFAACANVSFFVAAVNEARATLAEMKNPTSGNASGLLGGATTVPRDPITVGMIGCGRLGTQIVRSLLQYGGLVPSDLHVSTRRPELLGEHKERGVNVGPSNAKVAGVADVLVLAVPSRALKSVSLDVKDNLKEGAVIVSLVSAVPVIKLKQIFNYDQILKPEFYWESRNEGKDWSIESDVVTSMQDTTRIEMTCPLSAKKKESLVCTRAKIAEQFLYAFVNLMTAEGHGVHTVLDLAQMAIFGTTDGLWQDEGGRLLTNEDLTKSDLTSGFFPNFDLTSVATHETPLTNAFKRKARLRQGFVNHFKETFECADKIKLKVKMAPA